MTSRRRYYQTFKALEDAYYSRFLRVNNTLRANFIKALKANGPEAAKASLSNTLIDKNLIKALESLYMRAGLKGAQWTYNDLTAASKEGLKAIGFGRNDRWVQAVLEYLKINLLEFAAKVTDTMKADILKVISKGIDEGWGIDRMVKEMDLSELPPMRARTIARTEVVRAANVGHSIGAKSFPYEVNKIWSAASDHRTRHSHRTVNKHVIDENGVFKVPVYKGDKPTGKVDLMSFPGDPQADPSNTINCRCRIIHEPQRDGAGKLIRRPVNTATVIPLRQSYTEMPEIGIAAQRKALIDSISVGVE